MIQLDNFGLYFYYRLVVGKSFTNSYFGEGTGKALLSDFKCNGTEVDLLHCSLHEGGRPYCDHSHDAGVSCAREYLI